MEKGISTFAPSLKRLFLSHILPIMVSNTQPSRRRAVKTTHVRRTMLYRFRYRGSLLVFPHNAMTS